MSPRLSRSAVLAAATACLLPAALYAGQVTGLISFSNGTVADANEVNANFDAIKLAVDDNDSRIAALEGGGGGGTVVIGGNAADCPSSAPEGALRMEGGALQVCLSTGWSTVASPAVNFFGSGVDGALVTSGDVLLPANLDGDMVVRNYSSLTINAGHTLTLANRAKGLIVYVEGDAVINGTLSMTARGANADPVADGVPATGLQITMRTPSGTDFGSPSFSGAGAAAAGAIGNHPVLAGNGTVFTIARAGAAGAGGRNASADGDDGGFGTVGSNTLTTGGGGAGGTGYPNASTITQAAGTAGTAFSGGSGGGGCRDGQAASGGAAGIHGGKGGGGCGTGNQASGGGAGNPGGSRKVAGNNAGAGNGEDGTGGILILIVGGDLSGSGFIEANGSAGGGAPGESGGSEPDDLGGGGSGGGAVLVLHRGSINGWTGTVAGARWPRRRSGGLRRRQRGRRVRTRRRGALTPPVTGTAEEIPPPRHASGILPLPSESRRCATCRCCASSPAPPTPARTPRPRRPPRPWGPSSCRWRPSSD